MDITEILNVLFLRDYNTRLVISCTTLLGFVCGLMGGFLLLRKRSLMGDALSHAMLPGIGIFFIVGVMMGGDGKSLPWLLSGATVTGFLGCATVLFIRSHSRIKDDAAMGIVLSVFFGMGVVVLGFIQSMPQGSAAGLESFIYGKTASMLMSDFRLLIFVAGIVLLFLVLFFKEFRLLCFDEAYASSQGWPVSVLDILLLALATAVTVAGLQAVGLILVIAFLITPAAAARFWSEHFDRMLLFSGLIGGISGWLGAAVSALVPRLPAGALIVLVAAGCFLFSMAFGFRRGVFFRFLRQYQLKRSVGLQHLLRSLYEILETEQLEGEDVMSCPVPFRQVRGRRTWSDRSLYGYLRRACRSGLVKVLTRPDAIVLTDLGLKEAAQVTRNHRLWELYLIEYADVATSRVDRDADTVEHVLGEKMVAELEAKLLARRTVDGNLVPPSPHPIQPGD